MDLRWYFGMLREHNNISMVTLQGRMRYLNSFWTFATDLLNRGMRIEEVMVLMGHTKIETTLIYCNIKQDNVRESYRKYAA